jgi:Temperature dependent protein affecting M2 dsRNA replication
MSFPILISGLPKKTCRQLIYLQRHAKSYVHALFGPTETFLYPGVDKLITSLDFSAQTPTFQFASKRALMTDLGLSEEQFLDTGLLAGCDHLPTFPPTVHEQSLKSFVEMMKYYKSGHSAVHAFLEHPGVKQTSYMESYCRARSMVKYSLILTSDGNVQPLPLAHQSPNTPSHHGHHPPHHVTAADIPQDLHDVFTHRLPDEIYFYLSRGLISPQVLVWLTSGQVNEAPPLDNGETNEYRRFVKEVITEGVTGPRATALALVSSVANNFWATKRVLGAFWFEPGPVSGQKVIMHSSPQTTQLAERVAGWNVTSTLVEEELRRQNVSCGWRATEDATRSIVLTAPSVVDYRLCVVSWRDQYRKVGQSDAHQKRCQLTPIGQKG